MIRALRFTAALARDRKDLHAATVSTNRESRDQCGPRACASVIIGTSVLLWAAILWALGVI